MNTLIHADIFFFITTIAVVLLTLLLIVVAVYLIGILHDVRYISGVVREQTDLVAADIDDIRRKVREEGIFGGWVGILARMFGGNGKRSSKRK